MGLESEDAYTTELRTVLRIAHTLREVTAISCPPSHLPLPTGDAIVNDSISLPIPQPLLPLLLEAGISSEIASAASQIYHRRAEELRQHIQESIAATCRKTAESPILAHASPPDLLMMRVVSIFTDVYFRRLEVWKEEIILRMKQSSELPPKAAPRHSRTFNQEYVPLLEHFFEENPFPTHADKLFLAKKSSMQYRQIHVWFQNRRNRTKREGKTLRKKSTHEKAMNPLDKLCERMKGYVVDSDTHGPEPSHSAPSKGTTKAKVAWDNASKDAFSSSSPPHAFPSPYPPTCRYDPFPCKSGPAYFTLPEWRRAPSSKPPPSASVSIDDLLEKLSHLNIRDETRSKGSPKLQSYAATAAITVIPSRAPHPSLIIRKYFPPTNIARLHPTTRAPAPCSKAFRSPSPASKPITSVPLSVPLNKNGLGTRKTTTPLPQRFPGRRNTHQDTTPSESSSTSSLSSRSFSTDSESRSYSSSCVSSLSTPSDVGSVQELPRSFRSSCRSPFDSPIHLRGLGEMVATSPSSFS